MSVNVYVCAVMPEYPAHYLPDRDASSRLTLLSEWTLFPDLTKVEKKILNASEERLPPIHTCICFAAQLPV